MVAASKEHANGRRSLCSRHGPIAVVGHRMPADPGNVGTVKRRDEQFSTICKVARDQGKPVRIGVNGGSLNQELVMARMRENTDRDLGLTSEEIINECMVLSAEGPDHHLVQDVAAAGSDCDLSRAVP